MEDIYRNLLRVKCHSERSKSRFLVAQPFQAVPKTQHRLESLCYQNLRVLAALRVRVSLIQPTDPIPQIGVLQLWVLQEFRPGAFQDHPPGLQDVGRESAAPPTFSS